MPAIDLSDLQLEFDVISFALKNGGLPEGTSVPIFAGEKTRWLAEKIEVLGRACSISLLLSELHREGREGEVPEWQSLLGRLVSQDINPQSIPTAVERLKELTAGRKLANLLGAQGGVAEMLKNQQIRPAINELEKFLFGETTLKESTTEGSFIADEVEILEELRRARRQEAFQGIPTLIEPLDEAIYGLFKQEIGLIVGGTGEGKSIALLDIGARNWEWGGKNVIMFTLEMKRLRQELRLLSWSTSLPIDAYRSGGQITDSMFRSAEDFFRLRRERENVFYFVDIPEKATAAQIEKRLYQIEREQNRKYDLVLIDYLNIMNPVGSAYKSSLDWDAMAAVAWDIHGLARRTDKAIWTAAQKKENIPEGERNKGTLKSIGLSYLIAHPMDIVLVFTEKTLEGFMDVNVAKGRDVAKARVKLRPDLRHAKIHRIEQPIVRPEPHA
jgi:replicative DNA helicase